MNLKQQSRILYISSVDVSVGNGPGVNEREFVVGLYSAIKERAHFLIPQPTENFSDLPSEVCTFSYPHHKHHPVRYPLHILSQIRLANKILSKQRFDLIVFRLDVLPFAPFFITRRNRVPYVLKTLGQGMINVLYNKGGILGKSLAGTNEALVKKLVDGALLADSVSKAQVAILEEKLGVNSHKVVWIDNAVNTSRFYPVPVEKTRQELGLDKFDPIIGYVGTRPWERGGMQLVEAAPRLLNQFPNLGVVVLGGGSQLESLVKRAEELGVTGHCVFTGYVPFQKVPMYVNSLDVGVSISLRSDRSNASELKVRQYLACGKPVVISPGSNDFVIEENFGSVVPPNDVEAVAETLEQWLKISSDERKAFSQRAAEYMENKLSIEAVIDERFRRWSEKYKLNGSN